MKDYNYHTSYVLNKIKQKQKREYRQQNLKENLQYNFNFISILHNHPFSPPSNKSLQRFIIFARASIKGNLISLVLPILISTFLHLQFSYLLAISHTSSN